MDQCDVCNGDNSTCKAIHRHIRITTIGEIFFLNSLVLALNGSGPYINKLHARA